MSSSESRILWSLLPMYGAGCRTASLMMMAILATASAADESSSSSPPPLVPDSGVTIRLELQPSAPETDKSPAEVVAAEKPQAEAPAATKIPVEKVSADKVKVPAEKVPAEIAQGDESQLASEGSAMKRLSSRQARAATALDLRSPPLSNARSSREAGKVASKLEQSDRDFSNERLESEEQSPLELELKPDDVPLEQEEHPFDAPAAKSRSEALTPQRPAPIINKAELDASQFSQRELNIKAGIQTCLNYYLTHPENTTRRGPWALMHAALPLGVECEVIAGNRRVNTIGWLCFNGSCGKQNMFQPTRTGFRPNVGPGVQGHDGQFLAILAQSRVPADYPLQINKRQYTVMDLARYEMATCREKSELTFKLIGLSYYLEPNQQWRDDRGKVWSLEKMVAEELAQPINGAACGGVHRLMGLSYSLIQRQADGQAIAGHWQRSKIYLNDYVNYTMSLQNPDGSFSTNWLESRGMDPKVERKVQTTGHILEWLVYTLPDDHLRSPRMQLAMEYLLNTVGREPHKDWPIGPRGHALRAMTLYSQRVFGAEVGQLKSYVADAPAASQLR